MRLLKRQAILLATVSLASCSFGPRAETSMPQIRNIPVLANLSPADSFARARAFLASKQYGLAIELYKAASRDPSLTAESLNGLGVAYDGIGRRDLAERYFQRALAARPGNDRAKRNLATFYAASGQGEKRRELLADVTPTFAATVDMAADQPLSTKPTEASAVQSVRAIVLGEHSPLGSTYRPLMVQATNGSTVVREPDAQAAGETTIVCAPSGPTDITGRNDADIEIFRISMGEIFIATRPKGTDCSIRHRVGDVAPVGSDKSTSNSEYLGLVADYLDRLNRGVGPMADISTLWRTVFWPHEGHG